MWRGKEDGETIIWNRQAVTLAENHFAMSNRASADRSKNRNPDAGKSLDNRSAAFCVLVFVMGLVLLLFAALALYFICEVLA